MVWTRSDFEVVPADGDNSHDEVNGSEDMDQECVPCFCAVSEAGRIAVDGEVLFPAGEFEIVQPMYAKWTGRR